MPASFADSTVPSYQCPAGTKMWLLDLGTLECDEGWLVRGGNTSTLSNKQGDRKRRELIVLAILISHPEDGLILFETGCAENIDREWAAVPPLTDIFPRTKYEDHNTLPNQIKKTGHDIKDIAKVVISHAHLDHAGGLEHFRGTQVPIYIHEMELKHAFHMVATKGDHGVYLDHYLKTDLNWKTFTDSHFDLFQGIILHHAPGHTPGLVVMQVNLPKSGTFIATSDFAHVKENYEDGHPHGWLARDHDAWLRSLGMLQRLQKHFRATMIYGHDKTVADDLLSKQEQTGGCFM